MTTNETSKLTKTRKGQVAPLSLEEKAKVAEACLKYGTLVKQIAGEYVRPGASLDLEDLSQIGYEALIQAVRSWREDGGASFVTIARGDIRNAICAAIGAPKKGRKAVQKDMLRGADSLDEPYDDGESLRDLIGQPATQEEDLSAKELDRVLASFSDDDRSILKAAAEGYSDSEIAQESGLDRSWVGKRRRAATKSLVDAVNDFEPLALVA